MVWYGMAAAAFLLTCPFGLVWFGEVYFQIFILFISNTFFKEKERERERDICYKYIYRHND